MLATLVGGPFDDPDWLFEVKWDGFRVEAVVHDEEVRLWTRGEKDAAQWYFGPFLEPTTWIAVEQAIVDGEVIALDARGEPDFALLQARIKGRGVAAEPTPFVYEVFDLLYVDGRSLIDEPLEERRRLLADVLRPDPRVRVSEHIEGEGRAFFEAARARGLEGIMAKDRRSPVAPPRARHSGRVRRLDDGRPRPPGSVQGHRAREGAAPRDPRAAVLAVREVIRRGNHRRRGADDDHDHVLVRELDLLRIACVGLTADVHRDRHRRAELPDAGLAQLDAPLNEELTEGVWRGICGLGVEDAARIVGVEGRDARLVAHLDAAVRTHVVEIRDLRVLDVDPDPRGHDDRLAVDEDVQVGVDVVDPILLGSRLETGLDRALERV
jgi:hypothetical protein